jgi:hypothetical protein
MSPIQFLKHVLVQNAECLLRYAEKIGDSGQKTYLFDKNLQKIRVLLKKKIFLQEKIF